MQEIKAAPDRAEAYQAALRCVVERLNPERALVMFGEDAEGNPIVVAGHGVEAATVLLTGDISLETLRHVMRTAEPLQLVDAQQSDYADRNSVVLSGLRSVLCVPLMGPGGDIDGLVYADNRIRAGAFGDEHLDILSEIAQNLAQRLNELPAT